MSPGQIVRRATTLPAIFSQARGLLLGFHGSATEDVRRARERQRRVLLTALASALAKATSVATMLVSVPLTLHYLGEERYGMWITISSFALMLNFADFGVGNGLLTAISRASGRDDMVEVRTYISSGGFVLSLIGLGIALLAVTVVPAVDWAGIFRVRSPAAVREAGPAMAAFALCFALSIPLTLVQRAQLGLQRGFLSSLWQCGASLMTLLAVLTAVWLHAPLSLLVWAFLGPPLVVALANSAVFFFGQLPEVAPTFRLVLCRHASEVLRLGGLFFVLQVTVAIAYLSDNFVISRTLGAAHVTGYSIADRLFSVVSLLIGFVVMPLWPAFGEALSRGDTAWARRTLVRGTVLAFGAASAVSLALLIAAPVLIRIWIGKAVTVPLALLAGMALWRVVEATANTASMYLNAVQAIRFQVAIAVVTGLAAITLKLALIHSAGVWILPWITLTCYLLFAAFPSLIFLRRNVRP